MNNPTNQVPSNEDEPVDMQEYLLLEIETIMRQRAVVYAQAKGEDFRNVDFTTAAKELVAIFNAVADRQVADAVAQAELSLLRHALQECEGWPCATCKGYRDRLAHQQPQDANTNG